MTQKDDVEGQKDKRRLQRSSMTQRKMMLKDDRQLQRSSMTQKDDVEGQKATAKVFDDVKRQR